MRTRRRRRMLLAALFTLASPALLAAAGAVGPAQAAWVDPTDPAPALGWGTATYGADFTHSLDTTKWKVYNYPTAASGTSAANVTVGRGALHLTGQLDGPVVNGLAHDEGAGMMSTRNATYGRWEVRMRVSAGAGYGAAMTLWPQSQKWPDDGEIDVVEIHGTDRSKVAQIVHLGPQNRQLGLQSTGDGTGYHVYGVDWEPTSLRFYIDGRLNYTVTDPTMIPSKPMHPTLQLNQGCTTWLGCRDATTPPVITLDVDWMRQYPAATP